MGKQSSQSVSRVRLDSRASGCEWLFLFADKALHSWWSCQEGVTGCGLSSFILLAAVGEAGGNRLFLLAYCIGLLILMQASLEFVLNKNIFLFGSGKCLACGMATCRGTLGVLCSLVYIHNTSCGCLLNCVYFWLSLM